MIYQANIHYHNKITYITQVRQRYHAQYLCFEHSKWFWSQNYWIIQFQWLPQTFVLPFSSKIRLSQLFIRIWFPNWRIALRPDIFFVQRISLSKSLEFVRFREENRNQILKIQVDVIIWISIDAIITKLIFFLSFALLKAIR